MAKQPEHLHARYLGGTTVVMPDLAGRDRCCLSHNQRDAEQKAWEEAGSDGLSPHTLLETGDVILLDPHSATREDFEVVTDAEGAPSPKPRKQRSE